MRACLLAEGRAHPDRGAGAGARSSGGLGWHREGPRHWLWKRPADRRARQRCLAQSGKELARTIAVGRFQRYLDCIAATCVAICDKLRRKDEVSKAVSNRTTIDNLDARVALCTKNSDERIRFNGHSRTAINNKTVLIPLKRHFRGIDLHPT